MQLPTVEVVAAVFRWHWRSSSFWVHALHPGSSAQRLQQAVAFAVLLTFLRTVHPFLLQGMQVDCCAVPAAQEPAARTAGVMSRSNTVFILYFCVVGRFDKPAARCC